jgi:hypothetical protein
MNLDARLTAADASRFFRVEREVIYQWVARYGVEVRDNEGPRSTKRYRLGDLLDARLIATLNDTGRARNCAGAA